MTELGRYAGTVLAAYGISAVLLVGLVWQTLAANARARRDLDRQENQPRVRDDG